MPVCLSRRECRLSQAAANRVCKWYIYFGGTMINFENVSCRILKDISLNIPKGETVGLIGSSGAGKTTLIKLACGLLAPEKGKIFTLGADPVKGRNLYGETISTFIAGTPLLCPDDSVLQGFEIIRCIYKISKSEFANRYDVLSMRLGFFKYGGELVKNLSLGERMRAEIGAALIYEPELLILDEPNIGLDENAKSILGQLLTERREAGMTTLLSSHDMASVSKICSRIAMLDKGELVFYGSMENLRSRYTPIDTMSLKIEGRLPDLEDMPLKKYSIENNALFLSYNSNSITAAEILRTITNQTKLSGVSIKKPNLEDVISQLRSE